ncbi:MAG: hypothetical protein NTV55_13440 [Planctomycetota bacterium]|nr:hypothetical protein [Planctomycetota bacterium]
MRQGFVSWMGRIILLGIVAGCTFALVRQPEAKANQSVVAAVVGGGPRYTVVDTDITNLMVVDNSTNLIHFYTVDQGKEPGSDLKLRGSLNLNEVGKPVLKPIKVPAEVPELK